MIKQQVSHIARMRAQYAYNRAQVLWLTGMSEEQLFAFQFDTGMDWLERFGREDRSFVFELLHQSQIWKWWINEWNRRDSGNLPSLYALPARERYALYRQLHQEVFIHWTPPWNYLRTTFALAAEVNINPAKTHHDGKANN